MWGQGAYSVLSGLAMINGGIDSSNCPMVVSGASGRVGRTEVRLLAMMDFDVSGAPGKLNETENLKAIGARRRRLIVCSGS